MPGNGPAPSGRAAYARMASPLCPFMDTVSEIMPSYWSVWYACAMCDLRVGCWERERNRTSCCTVAGSRSREAVQSAFDAAAETWTRERRDHDGARGADLED